MMTVDAHARRWLQYGSEQGDTDMMNGAMLKTEARTMLTRWCYGCYNDKDQATSERPAPCQQLPQAVLGALLPMRQGLRLPVGVTRWLWWDPC